MHTTECDIAIIGSGIAGSITACILAKHGVRVALIDQGRHPRFAIGESMIPATSAMLRIMADRYGVPELEQCSTFAKLRRHVTSSSGMKRNFSFVHHVKGAPFDPRKSTMLPIQHYPHGPEAHLMRQDSDAFLYAAAIRYGTIGLDGFSISGVEFSDDGAVVHSSTGDQVSCRYVVDASGQNSALAKQFSLRDQPPRMKAYTRSLFTHMAGVKPYEAIVSRDQHDLPQPLSQGTLHHIFDGGWLWVIPFDNFHSATNPLCSVGLQLDPRKFPDTGKGPEMEFQEFLRDYPEIAPQFADARAVRRWVSTPRLQYSSSKILGPRYCLLAHAAGFVDPLFSRGLHITMEAINALSHRLISATRDGDFSEARFAHMEPLTQSLIDSHDRLTHGSLIAFRDFELWNAWYRIWALGGSFTAFRFRRAHMKYKMTQDLRYLDALEQHEYLGTPCPEMMEYQTLFTEVYDTLVRVESEEITVADAIKHIYRLYDAPWIPSMYGLTDPARHFITTGDLNAFVDSALWGYLEAPPAIRQKYFDFPSDMLASEVRMAQLEETEWMRRVALDSEYPGHREMLNGACMNAESEEQLARLKKQTLSAASL